MPFDWLTWAGLLVNDPLSQAVAAVAASNVVGYVIWGVLLP